MYRCFTVFSKVTHVRRKREAWVREAWRRVDLGSGVFIVNFEHVIVGWYGSLVQITALYGGYFVCSKTVLIVLLTCTEKYCFGHRK